MFVFLIMLWSQTLKKNKTNIKTDVAGGDVCVK